MQGTIITLPSRGPPVTKTIHKPPTLECLKAAVGGGDIEFVPGFDTIPEEISKTAKKSPANSAQLRIWAFLLPLGIVPGLDAVAPVEWGLLPAAVSGDRAYLRQSQEERPDNNDKTASGEGGADHRFWNSWRFPRLLSKPSTWSMVFIDFWPAWA